MLLQMLKNKGLHPDHRRSTTFPKGIDDHPWCIASLLKNESLG